MVQQMENRNVRRLHAFRSPTLETVAMVDRTIEANSGELKRTQIWDKLPRKIMWPTFVIILNYLQEINKIIISD